MSHRRGGRRSDSPGARPPRDYGHRGSESSSGNRYEEYERFPDRRPRRDESQRSTQAGASGSDTSFISSNTPYTEEELEDFPRSPSVPSSGRLFEVNRISPRNENGQRTLVFANHFPLQSLPSITIWQYSLAFRVPEESRRRGVQLASKNQCARAIEKASQAQTLTANFVFDGVSKGYSTRELCSTNQSVQFTIDMDGHTDSSPNQVELRVSNEGELDIPALYSYLRAGNIDPSSRAPNVSDCLRALTAIFRHYPAHEPGTITRPNSSAFYKRTKELTMALKSTGGVLEAIQGVHQSIMISFGGQLCVNVDTACSAFFTPGICLLDLARAYSGISPTESLSSSNLGRFRAGCDRLRGLFFVVRRPGQARQGTPRKARVLNVAQAGAGATQFEIVDPATNAETKITVADYFSRRYGITLRCPQVPLVTTQSQGYFPMELCYMPEGERYKEPLQGAETADFIRACTVSAKIRRNQIAAHLRRLKWHKQTVLRDMGISVATSMLEVRAKVLTPPIPEYASNTDSRPPDGSWNLLGKRFQIPKKFKAWGLMYITGHSRAAPDDKLQSFCREFARTVGNYGIDGPTGPPVYLRGNPHGSMSDMIGDLVHKSQNAFKTDPDILLFVIHQGVDPSIYKAIKNVCELDGYASLVMIAEKSVLSTRPLAQYLGNIAMKLNVRLGGTNHSLKDPLFGRPIMMMGGDVSHPSPGQLRTETPPPSFTALVGSMDQRCALYSAVSTAQDATQELMMHIDVMFETLLERFKKKTNVFPERIIYWRDGISDSQVPEFMAKEIKALKDFRSSNQLKFKLTVVNCLKRHHTRFFPGNEADADKNGNVRVGTVVENSSKSLDFYAVTQKALQGTAVPCHYRVLYDENELAVSDIQRLVMNGCFAYARATRSVSLHPAVYYAHQVADRARNHLRTEGGQTILKDVHERLSMTMYWQ